MDLCEKAELIRREEARTINLSIGLPSFAHLEANSTLVAQILLVQCD